MRKGLLFAAVFLLSSLSYAQVSVALNSPANGSSVSSPVTVSASARGTTTITGWYVYLDNSPVWHTSGPTSSIAPAISVGSGAHSIHVRAWQSNGAYGDAWSTVNVGTGSTTKGLPVPPSGARVISKIEDTTDKWTSCSDCAGGANTGTNFWTAPFQTSPSRDGASREFFIGGIGWTNALWIKKLGNQNAYKNFLWDFWVYFDSPSIANLWTAEYDLWQSVSGQEFMMGTQCNFGLGRWDVWDSGGHRWVGTTIPCQRFSANNWHHIQWYMQRVSGNQYKFVTLAVDGVAYSLNRTFYTNRVSWADSMGVQWQLDLAANGGDAHQWVDQVKVSLW